MRACVCVYIYIYTYVCVYVCTMRNMGRDIQSLVHLDNYILYVTMI